MLALIAMTLLGVVFIGLPSALVGGLVYWIAGIIGRRIMKR